MIRNCPDCNCEIFYEKRQSFLRASREKRVCNGCRNQIVKNKLSGRKVSDEKRQFLRSLRMGIPSWNKGIPMSEETKTKISKSCKGREPWSKGKTFSSDYIKKLQDSHFGIPSPLKGRKVSDETRYKIRKSIIEGLKAKNISQRGNPTACRFIDLLNESMGWKLQHASNGGEIEIYGYFLDGYDAERGIIFEYDEPKHHLKKKKQKDQQRQNDLFDYFKRVNKPISFWRYDERYKTLYEVLP